MQIDETLFKENAVIIDFVLSWDQFLPFLDQSENSAVNALHAFSFISCMKPIDYVEVLSYMHALSWS